MFYLQFISIDILSREKLNHSDCNLFQSTYSLVKQIDIKFK